MRNVSQQRPDKGEKEGQEGDQQDDKHWTITNGSIGNILAGELRKMDERGVETRFIESGLVEINRND